MELFDTSVYTQYAPVYLETVDPAWRKIEADIKRGEVISTSSGQAAVTRTEQTENEAIIFADYGSGIGQPHTRDGVKKILPASEVESVNAVSGWILGKNGRNYNPLYYEVERKRQRRHSPKGKASGWIEERKGNLKRKNPSTSYYYCWQEGDRRGKVYVPVRQMSQIWQMVNDRRSVDEILQAITKRPNDHHTDYDDIPF